MMYNVDRPRKPPFEATYSNADEIVSANAYGRKAKKSKKAAAKAFAAASREAEAASNAAYKAAYKASQAAAAKAAENAAKAASNAAKAAANAAAQAAKAEKNKTRKKPQPRVRVKPEPEPAPSKRPQPRTNKTPTRGPKPKPRTRVKPIPELMTNPMLTIHEPEPVAQMALGPAPRPLARMAFNLLDPGLSLRPRPKVRSKGPVFFNIPNTNQTRHPLLRGNFRTRKAMNQRTTKKEMDQRRVGLPLNRIPE